ncbi:MAG: alanine dehydrogenase [Phycisphaerae bacterium]
MRIGVPREIKSDEHRIAMMPVGVEMLVAGGHEVLVESGAGVGSGFDDAAYEAVGGRVTEDVEAVFDVDMIVKVKEPQPAEIARFKPGQVIFTYFHFAADRALTERCLEAGIVAVAYETIVDRAGKLPLLTPMSEIAGKMSVQEGAKYLEKPMQGRGMLLGGVPGVAPSKVVVLGGGVVGTNAAKVAAGLGAHVALMDVNLDRLRYLDDVMPANVDTLYADPHNIRQYVAEADLVIGAVLVPGAKAPHLVRREHLRTMKDGAVIVDVAVDQGGCVETSRPTTHQDPIFIVDGVVHYCVANMPGAVARTSTIALCNATMPYAVRLAKHGYLKAAAEDAGLALGVNMAHGVLTNAAVADAFDMPYTTLDDVAHNGRSARAGVA